MFFDLIHFTWRKDLKGLGILNLSLMPKESGFRSLISIQYEIKNKQECYTLHYLFNFNTAWIRTIK